jgi:hypothetical protein
MNAPGLWHFTVSRRATVVCSLPDANVSATMNDHSA